MNTSQKGSYSGAPKKHKGAAFFTIDRRTWLALCDSADVNQAATYLTIAQGVCKFHSKWSAKSVETYAGISRLRAAKYINQLIVNGFLRLGPKHTKAKPQYFITPYAELTSRDRTNASTSENVASDTLWLPSTLVQGASGKTSTPLSELVATQDIAPLRVLIDLYAEQNLVADGGISRQVAYEGYKKEQVGERGAVIIWAFLSDGHMHRGSSERWKHICKGETFWDAIKALTSLGLLGCVAHLTQSDSLESEIVHALPNLYIEGPLESETDVSRAAREAGSCLLTPELRDRIEMGPLSKSLLVPVKRHLPKVHCFGIFRLTHRPHTKLTAEWALQSQRNAEIYIPFYRRLATEGVRAEEKALQNYHLQEYKKKLVKSA